MSRHLLLDQREEGGGHVTSRLTSRSPCVTSRLTSRSPCVTSRLTSRSPCVTSRLTSRSPCVKRDGGDVLRRFPATTVLLPAKLHSDSCNSIFSVWDIDREEEGEDREDRGWGRQRAPLAHFRRSYILSDCRQSRPPPVTLSARQMLLSTLNIKFF